MISRSQTHTPSGGRPLSMARQPAVRGRRCARAARSRDPDSTTLHNRCRCRHGGSENRRPAFRLRDRAPEVAPMRNRCQARIARVYPGRCTNHPNWTSRAVHTKVQTRDDLRSAACSARITCPCDVFVRRRGSSDTLRKRRRGYSPVLTQNGPR